MDNSGRPEQLTLGFKKGGTVIIVYIIICMHGDPRFDYGIQRKLSAWLPPYVT